MSWLQVTHGGIILNLRIVPRASKDEVQGLLGDALKIRLQAPPVEGKANEALVRFLSKTLDLPSRNITLLSGQTGRNKRVQVTGISEADLRARLGSDGGVRKGCHKEAQEGPIVT